MADEFKVKTFETESNVSNYASVAAAKGCLPVCLSVSLVIISLRAR